MPNEKSPISLASFLMSGVVPEMMERDVLRREFLRLGRVLTLSTWLYEIGAILGHSWKDTLPLVVTMFEIEDKREEFTQFWSDQARRRLSAYGSQPRSFPIFVIQTDLEMFLGKSPEDLVKIGDKKLHRKEGRKWLKLAEASLIEGIFFGSMFAELTHAMLVNQYEEIDVDSWSEARSYGLTLPEDPPQMTVLEKEKEAIGKARDWVSENYPELIDDLGMREV